jgi:alpha-L-fucosidase
MRSSSIPLSRPSWRRTSDRAAVAEWSLRDAAAPAAIRLGEEIAGGQRVSRYRVEGSDGKSWRPLAAGTTIGHCKLDRLESSSPIRRVRLLVEETVAPPEPVRVELYGAV